MLHVMSCSVSVAKPLPQLTTVYCQSRPSQPIFIQSLKKILKFIFNKMFQNVICKMSPIFSSLNVLLLEQCNILKANCNTIICAVLMHHNVTQITWCNREEKENVGSLEINVNFLLLFTFRHDPHVQSYEHSFVSHLAGWHWSLESIGNTMQNTRTLLNKSQMLRIIWLKLTTLSGTNHIGLLYVCL